MNNRSHEKVETAITVTTEMIIVITMNRAKYIQILLDSLDNEVYCNDVIDIDVFIDIDENETSVFYSLKNLDMVMKIERIKLKKYY